MRGLVANLGTWGKCDFYYFFIFSCASLAVSGFSLVMASGGYSLGAGHRLLIEVTSLVAERGFSGARASLVATK